MYNPQQKKLVALCPRCQQAYGAPVKFTWWGGLVGPRLLHHVRCPNCRNEYNGKTGKSNQAGIILYFLVGFAICIMLLLLTRLLG